MGQDSPAITMQEKSRSILRRFVPAVLLGRNGHRQVVRHGHHLPRPATAKGRRLSPRTKYSTVLDRSRAQEPDRQCAARFGDLQNHPLGHESLRGEIKTVLIPEENAKDLVEISDSVKRGLEIVPVSRMDEVLAHALTRKPEAIEWDEVSGKPAETPAVKEESSALAAVPAIN